MVVKLLRAYQDSRYSLGTIRERQRCQLEALRQNRIFTPDVYLGLARVIAPDLNAMRISLDEIIENPTEELLHPESEYALVMRQLPEESRLDVLLQLPDQEVLRGSVELLAGRIAVMHNHLASPLSTMDESYWGSQEHLEQKLLHNFDLLGLVLTTCDRRDARAFARVQDRISRLEEGLFAVFAQWRERGYFARRVSEGRIKRCHGDLKSPNIWVLAQTCYPGQDPLQRVSVLDGADFNPSYTHIDVLSDIALLVADIQTRTQSSALAELLVQDYLRLTSQEDEVARAILGYYLVEKAIVGAAVSLVYDNLPDLGWAFFATAEARLGRLVPARA